MLTYRSRSGPAEALADRLRELGRGASAVACDTTMSDQVRAVVEHARVGYGRIRTVVSATGLVFPTGPLAEFSDGDFARVMRTDVSGFFTVVKAIVPAMRASGGGSITALTTSAAERTFPTDALSATPKAAVAMMVRMLAAEEGAHGIRVNAVGPGIVDDAGMILPMRDDPHTAALQEQAVDHVPLGRYALAAEVAERTRQE